MRKKPTQHQIIKAYLRQKQDWVNSYFLRGVQTDYGFIGHQGDRRARELAEAGEIEVRHDGKYAEYRTKEKPPLKYVFVDLPDGSRVARVIQ
jgi:hypothetical protein